MQPLRRKQPFELSKLANVILISSLIVLHLCYLATILGLPLLPPSNQFDGSTDGTDIRKPNSINQNSSTHHQRHGLDSPPDHAHRPPRPPAESSPPNNDAPDARSKPQPQPEPTNQNSTQTPNQNPNIDAANNDDENNPLVQQNENWLLQSEPARRELAHYLFYEFYQKNFTETLEPGTSFESAAGLAETGSSPSGAIFSAAGSAGATSETGVGGAGLNGSAAVAIAPDRLSVGVVTAASAAAAANATQGRPYFGDAFYSFQTVYWPIHCVICLAICTLGIFANVTNIIVLTRPNMITAVNTILSAMAFSDLIVNISNIPYLMHELSDASSVTSFYSFQWALYILFHAHTTVTAHTISIWLTCVLATWRYFVVCRSQSSNQRNWSVSLAKRTIVAVFLFVPIFCIPNYLSFAIVNDVTEANVTIYKVGFSHLADESQLIKTFHFWIFSCLTKLLPCVLLTFFTTVLIRKLLNARERRLRLATFGNSSAKLSIPNGGPRQSQTRGSQGELGGPLINGCSKQKDSFVTSQNSTTVNSSTPIANDLDNHRPGKRNIRIQEDDEGATIQVLARNANEVDAGQRGGEGGGESCTLLVGGERSSGRQSESKPSQLCQQSGSSCATDAEIIATSCNSSNSSGANLNTGQPSTGSSNMGCASEQPATRILSQLIVESSTNAISQATTVSTSTAHTKIVASCDSSNTKNAIHNHQFLAPSPSPALDEQTARSASTCGGLELYGKSAERGDKLAIVHDDNQPLVGGSPMGNSQDLGPLIGSRLSLAQTGTNNGPLGARRSLAGANSAVNLSGIQAAGDKRSSETLFGPGRARSMGSGTLVPMQMVKLQAAQRQLSQNETTTRLLIAVMIVFLICEFPAGILAALCAILGQDFFENVYQPTGILTDLLALINSSVNFILYCLMSTQFRITFYRVVLHCPAPNAPQHTQAMLVANNQQQQQLTGSYNNNPKQKQ